MAERSVNPSGPGTDVPPARKQWVTPNVMRIVCGSAENAFSQNEKDGQFTKS